MSDELRVRLPARQGERAYPGIPEPTQGNIVESVLAIKSIVEILTGQRGLKDDQAVTFRDALTLTITNTAANSGGTVGRFLFGIGPPPSLLGDNGDFYIDTASEVMYGPKVGGAWPSGVSLIGADGAPGANGVGVPAGGTTGQILAKIDGTDYNTIWTTNSGGAPTSADYLVKTANAGLSAERVVTDTTDMVWDWSTAGQAKVSLQAFTGDITKSANSLATTIANLAVTYAKMQNISATARVLGRKTAGAGSTEECTLSDVLDFIGSAAQGDILYRGASTWARLGAGTALQFLQTQGTGANPIWAAAPSAGTAVNIQIFSTSGTFSGASGWQKPTGAKIVDVHVFGGGGGGGGGRRTNTAATAASGGAGGAAGGYTWARFQASSLLSQETVVVGAKGSLGAGGAADNTNGSPGGNGTKSEFSTTSTPANYLLANGGNGGGGGTTTNTAGSAGGTGRSGTAQTGGTGSITAGGSGNPAAVSIICPTSGGGGAGNTQGSAANRNGGDGGAYPPASGFTSAALANGGIGSTKTNATSFGPFGYEVKLGAGGGGGWTASDSTAGNGADGTQPGGGGGGGGGSVAGNVAGSGGAGGDGAVVIITYLQDAGVTANNISRVPAGGRLTLTTATPVQVADATAQSTVYYTPYVDDIIMIYDGGSFIPITFAELSLALDNNAAHTGYHQSGNIFDLYVFKNGGATALGSGPAWASSASRSPNFISRLNGIMTNTASIVLRFGTGAGDTVTVGANMATYVGSMYCTANGQTGMAFTPAAAAGGSNNVLGLWNAYHRIPYNAVCRDSTASWAMANTWGAMNASNSNRITWLEGLPESSAEAVASLYVYITTGSTGTVLCTGIGFNSVTQPYAEGSIGEFFTNSINVTAIPVAHAKLPGTQGLNYAQQLERSNPNTSVPTAQTNQTMDTLPIRQQVLRLKVEM